MARNVRIDKEGGAQEMLFRWITYQLDEYPELALLYHIPNGGKRDAKTATILKRQGVKAGVPDLHLPVARGGYHGLYIELKVKVLRSHVAETEKNEREEKVNESN